MSKNTKVQMTKINPNIKLENLLNSYNTLKLILSPNLNEKNILFMNSIIDIIESQLKNFVQLLNINESKKIFEILNINNQNLSKQIANLYETITSSIYLGTSLFDKDRTENTQIYIKGKEFDLLEEQKHSFNIIDSPTYEIIDNKKDSKNFEYNEDFKEIKINRNEKMKEKKLNKDKNIEKLVKRDKDIRDKLKEKEKLIQNLKSQEKEKSRDIFQKAIKQKKKNKSKLNERKRINESYNNINNNNSKTHTNKDYSNVYRNVKNRIKSMKQSNYSSATEIKIEKKPQIKRRQKAIETEIFSYKDNNNKFRNTTPKRQKNKFKYFLFDDDEDENIEKGIKFQRRNKKFHTVGIDSLQVPYISGFERNGNICPMNISITFSNRFENKDKRPFKKKKNNKSMKIKIEENNNKKSNKINSNRNNNKIKTKTKTEILPSTVNRKNKNINLNLNLNNDYFSLEQYLAPYNQNGEKMFMTKTGSISINQNQKDFLEDYINNYLFDDNKIKGERCIKKNIKIYSIIQNTKEIKELIKSMKEKKNQAKSKNTATATNNDANDIEKLFQLLPPSFKILVDNVYLKKKKASLFDRSIFKICHNILDDYKELETKEDIFTFKTRPKSKSSFRAKSYSKNF